MQFDMYIAYVLLCVYKHNGYTKARFSAKSYNALNSFFHLKNSY